MSPCHPPQTVCTGNAAIPRRDPRPTPSFLLHELYVHFMHTLHTEASHPPSSRLPTHSCLPVSSDSCLNRRITSTAAHSGPAHSDRHETDPETAGPGPKEKHTHNNAPPPPPQRPPHKTSESKRRLNRNPSAHVDIQAGWWLVGGVVVGRRGGPQHTTVPQKLKPSGGASRESQ